MARRAAVKRRLLGEIPVFHAEGAGPTRAGLIFRVGRSDEGAASGGITHLVEHLALYRLGQQSFEYNGVVDPTWTSFWASGSAAEVAGFLTEVVRHLADLPMERLAIEQRILRDESAGRPASSFDHHSWLRYGFRGAGLTYMDELGLYGLTADGVRAWSSRWFTAGNAALVWTGSKLPNLTLDLPPGPRRLPTVPQELIASPTWAEDGPNLVTVSFTTPRTSAPAVALRVLTARLQQRLRYDLGVSYDVSNAFHPMSADVGLATVAATTAPTDAAAVRDAFVSAIDDMRSTGPTPGELMGDIERNRLDEDPLASIGEASRMASQELVGGPVETFEGLERKTRVVTPEAAREGFAALTQRMILTLPPGVPPPESFEPYPLHIAGNADGQLTPNVRERQFLWGSKFPGVRTSATMIGLEFPDGTGLRIRWQDCVGVVIGGDGMITVLDGTGGHISFHPNDLRGGDTVAAAVRAAVPHELFVEIPRQESDVAVAPPRADGTMKWALFGSFLLVVAATAGFGFVGSGAKWLANGPNALTVLAGIGILVEATLVPIMLRGARRLRPWSVTVAAAIVALTIASTALWIAGDGNPSYTWVEWVAAAFALGHLIKTRNRSRPPAEPAVVA